MVPTQYEISTIRDSSSRSAKSSVEMLLLIEDSRLPVSGACDTGVPYAAGKFQEVKKKHRRAILGSRILCAVSYRDVLMNKVRRKISGQRVERTTSILNTEAHEATTKGNLGSLR